MVNNIKNTVMEFSKENEEVRSLIETGRRLNPTLKGRKHRLSFCFRSK